MPICYNDLTEAQYNGLIEDDYNTLPETCGAVGGDTPHVYFKAGKVLFDPFHRVAFGPCYCDCSAHATEAAGCVFPSGVHQPSCVVARQFEFDADACIANTIDGGTFPMVLLFNGTNRWDTDAGINYAPEPLTSIKTTSSITFNTSTCRWVLSIAAVHTVIVLGSPVDLPIDVWTGEKTLGKTPVGTYLRVSGCDTTEQITVQ